MLTKQFEKPFGEYSHLARIFLVLKFIHIVKKVKENKDKQKKKKIKEKKMPSKMSWQLSHEYEHTRAMSAYSTYYTFLQTSVRSQT